MIWSSFGVNNRYVTRRMHQGCGYHINAIYRKSNMSHEHAILSMQDASTSYLKSNALQHKRTLPVYSLMIWTFWEMLNTKRAIYISPAVYCPQEDSSKFCCVRWPGVTYFQIVLSYQRSTLSWQIQRSIEAMLFYMDHVHRRSSRNNNWFHIQAVQLVYNVSMEFLAIAASRGVRRDTVSKQAV